MGPTQDLQQKVCQKYGWSLEYKKGTDRRWNVHVIMGLQSQQHGNSRRSFCTEEKYSVAEEKAGKAAVSALALEGLVSEIAAWEDRPVQDLTQVFASIKLEILDSHDTSTWARFWADPPLVVGIDTEGNLIAPPVLVQIATPQFVILETPRTRLSADLQRLLQDDSITKVFCDNFAHKDKLSLGLSVGDKQQAMKQFTEQPIVDLECLAMKPLGPVKTARGLGKLVALTMPELQVRIEKGDVDGRFATIGRFAMIEQGKAKPLRGLFDLKPNEQQYAALDAWCTLQVYQRLQQYEQMQLGE